MTTLTPRQRVERGVAWLDYNQPDWRSRVSLLDFDMGSTCRCVLGQVFGTDAADGYWRVVGPDENYNPLPYDLGHPTLTLTREEAIRFGFDASEGENFEVQDEYDELQLEWARELEREEKR